MKQAIAILIIMTACQAKDPAPALHQVDALLQPYVEEFYIQGDKRGLQHLRNRPTSIKAELRLAEQFNHLGECQMIGTRAQIKIDYTIASGGPDTRIRWVVFHEMGHGILGRDHNNAVGSIMNNDTNPNRDLKITDQEYIDELFNNRVVAFTNEFK